MDDKHIMAGANCKRALQNKSGERKRRRTNATFSSFPLEGDETVNKFIKTTTTTTTSLRQTRQTAQKYPITAASFAKANNKSEKQMRVNTTPISRKLLRSSTQNPAEDHEGDDNYDEQPLDYGELEKQRNTLTEFSISLRETDQTNFQKELEHVEMTNKLYLANAKCDLKTKKIIHNKVADDDEMPENQECDDLAVEEQDDQELDEHSEDEQQQHDMQEQPIKQNVPKEKEKKVGCNKLNSFGNIISTLVSRPVFNKATISPLSYLEIQSKYQCAPTEQKESRVNDQSDHYVINKLESLKDADEKQDLNKQQLDKTNTISNSVEKEESEDNNKTELYMEDIVEISKQDRERKIKNMVLSIAYPTQTLPLIANLTLEKHENSSEIPRQLHFKSFDDYNKEEEKYENELSSNNSSLSSDTSTTSSCKTTSEDNEAFHNGCKFRLKIKTQQKHQQVIKPASSVCNTQHPPSTNFGSSVSQNKHREQCNINNSNNNSTDVNYGCAIKSPTCSASTPTTANISHPSPITEQQTFISDPAVNNTTLNIDSHCVNKDNAEISPLPEKNTAAVADKCISSTQNPHIEKEPTDSNPNPNINTCEQTPHIDNRLDDGKINSRIDCKADSDNENLQRENNIVEKEQGEENNLELNRKDEQDQDFDKYLGSSQVQHTEFEMEHQQHEKDIIDAADKVYTHIEQQQQQQQYHQHVTSSYEHIISHQHSSQQQQQHHHHDHHQQRNDIELQQQEHLALIQSQQQHSMQQHYASEQLYQLQQEQQLHIQQQLLIQHQQDQQQRHDLSQNQTTDQRQQQNSNMMDFLHPQQHHPTSNTHSPLHQQHQQIHEVYHDLMMDEFHDDHNTPYKLSLSPSNVKHENQDDGYETSAGDVLTPKSHASSSHSVTPQHHVQHLTSGLLINTLKSEDHQQHKQLHLQQQQQLHINTQNVQQEVSANDLATNNASRDPYHFIGDDLNNGGNNSLRNIQTPPHSHTHGNAEPSNPGNFMVMQSDGSTADMTPTNELFCISNLATDQHAQQTQQSCTNLSSEMTHVKHQRPHFSSATIDISGPNQYTMLNLQAKPPQKRRGRKKKIMEVLPSTLESSNPNDVNVVVERSAKTRKKHDRFNGMSEEEVVKRTLPDHLCDNLDIVIIGINPGLLAAYKGHHYAGPGNHFWKCLYLSGLTQDQMSADEDFKLINYGIGFTNMVQRATKGSADLTRKEIKEGSRILLEKLQRFRPKIAVFNGKLIFEVFSGKKDFNFGRQPECVEGTDTFIWVMPSSSARCAQLPRAADKVPFYVALKKFRDYLKGVIPHIDEAECVFTEERIKLQCEQVNFKNHQNSANSNKETYANTDGISNNESLLQNSSGYPFDTETSSHGAAGAGGTGTPGNGCSASFMMSSLVGGQQEKKKRGRPKKITGQEIIDPVTGNKIQVNNQLQSHGGDYTNILNLSIVQGGNCEMPKKKRGRPKKVKPQPTQLDILGQQDTQSSILTKKPNIMSIQAMTGDITQDSPLRQHADLQTNHQHVSTLYSTPPYQRSLYSPMASPMASPSLNCSYTTNTPPSQPHHDKLGIGGNMREDVKTNSTDLVQSNHHQLSDQNLGESPPPSSPNICTVDFDPPAAASIAPSSNVNDRADTELNVIHQRLQNTHQRSRYNSPIHTEVTTDHNTTEHFQHWLSSQHNPIHSPASAATTAVFANSPQQQSSLHYHEQQQMQSLQQQQHQELHAQWPLRHQRHYEDAATSHYMPNSPQLHHTHTHHHDQNQNQNQHAGSDVARKSLSGLESLVDQIPKISESESVALSSAAAMTAQAAAAAAVESRLQGMRNDPQVSDSHFVNTTTIPNNLTASNSPTASGNSNNNQHQQTSCSNNLLSSNFSVSNLAASSASSNIINNHESYGLAANTRPPTNPNTYHHSNLMAAAVMAAASANTPTNLSTSTAASATAAHHAQMYMDPHAHLTTHVPVNSLYSPPNSHHHPATAAHHAAAAHHHAAAAAAHYGNAQHTAAGYANNPYAAAAQSNVNAAHTLHMPSPNYPYGYATAASQSSYSGYPHSHTSHHVHPHGHHTSHHLTMFDRLKPSDIGGYSGF